jgi:hypothetical protein
MWSRFGRSDGSVLGYWAVQPLYQSRGLIGIKVSGGIEVITDGERPLTSVNAGNRKRMAVLGATAGFVLPLLVIIVGTKVAPVRRT